MFYTCKHKCSFPPGIDQFLRLDVVKSWIEFEKSRLAVFAKAISANERHSSLSSWTESECFYFTWTAFMMHLILCTVASDIVYSSDCDSITSMGGARIYCSYLSGAYDDMWYCEGRVERSVLVRLRLNHIISFHMRRSIHAHKMSLSLVLNVKVSDSHHLTSKMHVWITHVWSSSESGFSWLRCVVTHLTAGVNRLFEHS